MISICKVHAPKKLCDGAIKSREDCLDYEENKDDYEAGRKKFSFRQGIFRHKRVKKALRHSQYGKCCYCEAKFDANAAGDVEHYRPKGAVRQDDRSERIFPGYFWLAYSWENLYWCCQMCNRVNKRDLFPLVDQEQRARSPAANLENETPLILDPGGSENPREHIKFAGAKAVGCTVFGRKTIEVVNLNRDPLLENRLEHFRVIEILNLARVYIENSRSEQDLQNINSLLDDYAKPCAKFSAMVNDYLTGLPS